MIKQTILLCIFTLGVPFSVNASNTIFKCVNPSDGSVTYLNTFEGNSGKCKQTDLATIDKLSTVSSMGRTTSRTTTGTASSVTVTNEQVIRDAKRELILNKELTSEKDQLTVINNMLKNVNTNDKEQFNKLKEMQQTHQRNINSLQKELGLAKTASAKPAPTLVSKTVPPKELKVINTLSDNNGDEIKMKETSVVNNSTNQGALPVSLPSVEEALPIEKKNVLEEKQTESILPKEDIKEKTLQQKLNDFAYSYKELFK